MNDDMPQILMSVGCRVVKQLECIHQNLTPLVTYRDLSIVPDWDLLMRGGDGHNKFMAQVRVVAYSYLSGQKMGGGGRNGDHHEPALPMFDIDEYRRG